MSGGGAPILETREFVAGYERDLPIVKGVDLSLAAGSFTAIFGPNGAGKSTLVKAMAGVVPVVGGSARLAGRELVGLKPHEIVRAGMAFVPQTENVFTTLSIRENLQLAAAPLDKPGRRPAVERMFAMFPDLAREPSRPAGSLSGGQRQMLAAARALVLSPDLLILDEPSAGLSPKLVGEVFRTLQEINASGVIMVDGRLRHDASARELLDHPDLGALFLGTAETLA